MISPLKGGTSGTQAPETRCECSDPQILWTLSGHSCALVSLVSLARTEKLQNFDSVALLPALLTAVGRTANLLLTCLKKEMGGCPSAWGSPMLT